MKVKTIDVTALEWFDKINGNSYFAAVIIVNYSMKSEKTFFLPFQYGYEDHYKTMAFKLLKEKKIINTDSNVLWSHCQDNGIILRTNKQNALKRELLNIGN
jgi:predicted RNA binding protein with dsRBD fold (UPF0201 family)